MLLKKITSFITIACMVLLCQAAFAKTSVWKISKGEHYFYLGGTIHLLNKNDYPLPKEFMQAYKDADKLIFEIDIASSQTLEGQQQFAMAMLNTSGKTLQDSLNASTYAQLKKFLDERGLPIQNFESFYPWAVGLTLSVIEYQRIGMQPEYGVDEYFNNLAIANNKEVGSLETLEQQIDFISSMGDIEPNRFINYTLRDLKELPTFASELTQAWRNGDQAFFTSNAMLVQGKKDFPDLYKVLLTQRNNNWMPQLLKLVNSKKTAFVLVGTLHLMNDDGLLNQLKQAGYKVEQL